MRAFRYALAAPVSLVLVGLVLGWYVSQGTGTDADHFRYLPEVQLFLEAYPDAKPGQTSGYTAGFISSEPGWVELSIYHDRFTLEPDRIIIDCTGVPDAGYVAEFIETRCGDPYPEGYEFYTGSAVSLPEVREFLEAYPDAKPGYTHRGNPGFMAHDGNVTVEASIVQKRFDPEPCRIIVDRYAINYTYIASNPVTSPC